jgi:hypothetical protein
MAALDRVKGTGLPPVGSTTMIVVDDIATETYAI